jgi:hypothetical protein
MDRNYSKLELELPSGPFVLEHDDAELEVGPFILKLAWEFDGIVSLSKNANCLPDGDVRTWKGYIHPHVGNRVGGICFGDARDLFFGAMGDARPADAIRTLETMLSDFHKVDSYIQVFNGMAGKCVCYYTGAAFTDADGLVTIGGRPCHPEHRVPLSFDRDDIHDYRGNVKTVPYSLDGSDTYHDAKYSQQYDMTDETSNGRRVNIRVVATTSFSARKYFLDEIGVCAVTGISGYKLPPRDMEGDFVLYVSRRPDDLVIIPGTGLVSVAALPYVPRTPEAHNVRINVHRSVYARHRIERVWPDATGFVRDEHGFPTQAPVILAEEPTQDGAVVAGGPEDAAVGVER